MQISNQSQDKYLFQSKVTARLRQITVRSDETTNLQIRTIDKKTGLKREHKAKTIPVCCSHYDRNEDKLYLGNVFGALMVYKFQPQITLECTRNMGAKNDSVSKSIILINTNDLCVFVATTYTLYQFNKKDLTLQSQNKWTELLVTACCLNNLSVMCFKDLPHPILFFEPVYNQVIDSYNDIRRLNLASDQIQNQLQMPKNQGNKKWWILSVKLNSSYVVALVALDHQGIQKTINLYNVQDLKKQGNQYLSLTSDHLHMRVSVNTSVYDIAVSETQVYVCTLQRPWSLGIQAKRKTYRPHAEIEKAFDLTGQ